MKRLLPVLLFVVLMTGCGRSAVSHREGNLIISNESGETIADLVVAALDGEWPSEAPIADCQMAYFTVPEGEQTLTITFTDAAGGEQTLTQTAAAGERDDPAVFALTKENGVWSAQKK